MESTVQVRTVEELHQELQKLESLVESQPEEALQRIGDVIADWEKLVRQTHDFALGLRIAELLEKVQHFWLALSWYHWWLEAVNEGDLVTKLRVLRSKGRVFIRLGMLPEALHILQEVEQLMPSATDSLDLPVLWQNLSMLQNLLGHYESALQYAFDAHKQFQVLGETHRASVVEFMIGTNLKSLKKFEDSFKYLTSARDGLEQHQDYFHLARAWHNYAELMRDWGRTEEAVAAWRMSLEMKKRTHDHAGQVNTLLSIAEYFMSRSDWQVALRYVTQAFPLCHQYRLYDQEVTSLECWATILFALGRVSELEVVATRATHLQEKVTVKPQVNALIHKVSAYFHQAGRADLAEKYGSQAIHNPS